MARITDPPVPSATFDSGSATTIYVSPNGNDANSGKTRSAAKKTLAAALTAMGAGVAGVIQLDQGNIDSGASCSLSGFSCSIQGAGPGSVITPVSVAQTGFVLDFTGYAYPANAEGRPFFNGFTVKGDGTAGIGKGGIKGGTLSGVDMDVTVINTGGPPIDWGAGIFNNIRATLGDPVSAAANNVPYFRGTGAFEDNEVDLLFRAVANTLNTGLMGAFVLVDDGVTFAPSKNRCVLHFEAQQVPTNGKLISIAGALNEVITPKFSDVSKATGATGTSFAVLAAPAVGSSGGNIWNGYVPGKGSGGANDIDQGISVSTNGNVIVGTKGYNGGNVVLNSGVDYNAIFLYGAESGATAGGITDNSGKKTNYYWDGPNQTFVLGGDAGWERGQNNELRVTPGYLYTPAGMYAGSTANTSAAQNAMFPNGDSSVGLEIRQHSAGQTADLLDINDHNATPVTRFVAGGTMLSDDNTKGIILKDGQGSPHYWRVTVSNTGVLTTTDLGTTRPSS